MSVPSGLSFQRVLELLYYSFEFATCLSSIFSAANRDLDAGDLSSPHREQAALHKSGSVLPQMSIDSGGH